MTATKGSIVLLVSQIEDQDIQSEYDSIADKNDDAAAERISTDGSSNGFLHGFTLANFLQYIEMDEKSWTLQVFSNEQAGFLHFHEGRLLDAQIDGKSGEEAALEILSWDHVDISVEDDGRSVTPKINRSLKYLIMEANRPAETGD